MQTLTATELRQRQQLACAAREAEGYLELGMHAQALGSLQRRGQLVHADGRACYLMGESLRSMRRYREALIPLRRSASLDARHVDTWLALGWCYKRIGQLSQAINALEVASIHSPQEAVLHYNLACYFSLRGERLEALRRLKRAFDLDPALVELVECEEDFTPMRNDIGLRMLLRAFA